MHGITDCHGRIVILTFLVWFATLSYTLDIFADGNTTYDYELMLRKKLLETYSVHVLPRQRKNVPIRVDMKLSVVSIRELNEKSERLTVETYVQLTWNDSRLTWNMDDYGGIKSVRFPHHMIWQPDIILFNSASSSEIDPWGSVYTLVKNNGNVRWVPPATLHSICNVDLRLYPYDTQTCYLKFGSWTLNGTHVDIALYNNESKVESTETYNENNEWEMIGSNATKHTQYYPCCIEPYPEVVYELRLRRRAPYYKLTTLYPTFAIVVLTLTSFWLPPTATEKVTLGCVSLIVLIIILVHLSWKLPPTGKSVPMIVWFCGNMVIIITVAITLSLISITWGRARHTRPAPRCLKIILNSWVGRILCVNEPIVLHTTAHGEPTTLELESDDLRYRIHDIPKEYYYSQDWIQCLQVLDRINFLVFIAIFAFVLGSSFDQ